MTGIARGRDGIARYTGLPPNLAVMLRERADARPAAVAVSEVDGPSLTYGRLWRRVRETAGGLRERGVARGDRVAVELPAGLDWVVGVLGVIVAGAIAVPVNTRLAPAERDAVIEDSGAALVLGDPADLVAGPAFADDVVGSRDPAVMFYTSGTTGRPKGVLMSHEALLTNAENGVRAFELTDLVAEHSLRTLVVVPLFHVTGFNSQLLLCLYGGGSATILPQFDAGRAGALIEAHRMTLLIGVPAVYELVLRHPGFAGRDVGSVTRIGYGGAATAPATIARIRSAFPSARLFNGFGQTETSSLTSVLASRFLDERPGSVGRPVPVAEVRLRDPDPATGVGELLVRSPTLMLGYWNQPARTAEVLRDGWLHTGDLARIEDGFIWIVDRMKDVNNRGGEKVYCVEIENALAAMPGVAEIAAVGVPDAVMGEKVAVAVVPTPGSAVEAAAVVAYLASRLADYKVPQFVAVTAEPLPRNPGGKVLKPLLRDRIAWGRPLR